MIQNQAVKHDEHRSSRYFRPGNLIWRQNPTLEISRKNPGSTMLMRATIWHSSCCRSAAGLNAGESTAKGLKAVPKEPFWQREKTYVFSFWPIAICMFFGPKNGSVFFLLSWSGNQFPSEGAALWAEGHLDLGLKQWQSSNALDRGSKRSSKFKDFGCWRRS